MESFDSFVQCVRVCVHICTLLPFVHVEYVQSNERALLNLLTDRLCRLPNGPHNNGGNVVRGRWIENASIANAVKSCNTLIRSRDCTVFYVYDCAENEFVCVCEYGLMYFRCRRVRLDDIK